MKKRVFLLILCALALSACSGLPIHTWPAPSARTPSAVASGTDIAITPSPTPLPSPAATPVSATPAPSGAEAGIAKLAALLPDKTGYQWQYNGFAEYASTLTLKTIANQGSTRLYAVEGTVADMSGGESRADFSVKIVYTVTTGALSQQMVGPMAMDRTLPALDLIRAPLAKGTKWTQAVKDSTGRSVTLDCSITDVRQVNGRNIYSVLYKTQGSDYYEKREITEGAGVTAYDKLFMYDAGREEIGYRVVSPETRADMTGWDKWLPRLDYEYTYFGLAEYGHKGLLSRVSATDTEVVYDFNGSYDDSTGDSSRFAVRYRVDLLRGTVTEQFVANERGKPEVNSKLHNLVILKFPLGMHDRWTHAATIDGKAVTVHAEVIEYDAGRGVVKVKYTAGDAVGYYEDTYVEIRSFEVGYGMTSFANLLPGSIDISAEDAQYADRLQNALNQHMFGYALNKTLIK